MSPATCDENWHMNLHIAPDAVILAAEMVLVSARDGMKILGLLEQPPQPNERLRAAMAALADSRGREGLLFL